MKQVYLFIILTFFSTSLFGQQNNIDSLLLVYKEHKIDSLRINTLNRICRYYYQINPEEGLVYADTLSALALKNNKKELISFNHNYKGSILIRKGELQKGIIEFKNGVKLIDSVGEEKDKYKFYSNIASAYRYTRDFEQATLYYNKAIDIVNRYDMKDRLIAIYNNLGAMAQSQENYNIAVDYFMKSLENREFNKNPRKLAITLVNLGTIHHILEQPEKVLSYSYEALKISEEDNYLTGIADSKRNIGKSFIWQNKNINDAISYLKEAAEIYLQLNDNVFLIEAYSSLGDALELINDLDNSINYHTKALELSQDIKMQDNILGIRAALARALIKNGDIKKAEVELKIVLKDTTNSNLLQDHLLIAYKAYSDLNSQRGNYKDALHYHKLYKEVNDKKLSIEKTKDVNELETKYETEKTEKENLQLKNDNIEQELLTQKANTRNWVLLFSLLILSTSAFFIWRRYKSEAKAKKTISKQKNQIEKQKNIVEALQKELHHRMKNNLSFIDLFINLAKERFSDNIYRTKLNELQNRMRSMFEIHKQLFKKEDITSVKAKRYIDTLVQNVQEVYNKKNITITNDTHDNVNLLSSTSFPVGLIVNEFVTNTYKYAFSDDEDGIINISLTSDDVNYHLTLQDNGKGLPQDFNIEDLDSFGMEIIQLLTKEYDGEFTLNGKGGVTMNIQLPKTAA
ncbi:tetratricopeptide repeat protein [uncultured Kordia sp.]|uniref:tetratricopeptide repeat-containing sensor histidine kinase n=1 Tax=uncultured Kordia sp. TaxID=507699 RepID=UPI002608349F|nr:tetratricopeptide repeat protein [uncultured Kordia sp.]